MRIVVSTLIACLACFLSPAVEVDNSVFRTASRCLAGAPVELKVNAAHYCIVENPEGKGYVILSRLHDGSTRILGYSTTGRWIKEDMPPALLRWIESLGMSAPADSNAPIDTLRQNVSPLLTCHWHQNSPYNDLAPEMDYGPIMVRCAAGCVAIAAAQITYYWRRDNPDSTLWDTPTYSYGSAPVTMSIPAGTPNEWELMLDEYYTGEDSPESRAAAARLCYVIGTTSYLHYGHSTGGHNNMAARAIYDQYCLMSEYHNKSLCSQQQWDSLLYNEVIARRPVLCSGEGAGGHAFVLDGYDKETGLYHFNFGWGGNGDGYYAIDDCDDAMGGFNLNQSVYSNIRPVSRNINTQMTTKLIEGLIGQAFISITNNSTLPITRLSLYAILSPDKLDENSIPVWQSEEIINNDNTTYEITTQQFSLPQGKNPMLYLTDENGDILARYSMENSSVPNMEIDRMPEDVIIYDLNGIKVDTPQHNTIYIIHNGMSTQKIIFK